MITMLPDKFYYKIPIAPSREPFYKTASYKHSADSRIFDAPRLHTLKEFQDYCKRGLFCIGKLSNKERVFYDYFYNTFFTYKLQNDKADAMFIEARQVPDKAWLHYDRIIKPSEYPLSQGIVPETHICLADDKRVITPDDIWAKVKILKTEVDGNATILPELKVHRVDNRVPCKVMGIIYTDLDYLADSEGITDLKPELNVLTACGNRILITTVAELQDMIAQERVQLLYDTVDGLPFFNTIHMGILPPMKDRLVFQNGVVVDYTGMPIFGYASSLDLTPHRVINTGDVSYFNDTKSTSSCYRELDLRDSGLTAQAITHLMKSDIPKSLTGIKFPRNLIELELDADDFYPDASGPWTKVVKLDYLILPDELGAGADIGNLSLDGIHIPEITFPAKKQEIYPWELPRGMQDHPVTINVMCEYAFFEDYTDESIYNIHTLNCPVSFLVSLLDTPTGNTVIDIFPELKMINNKPISDFFTLAEAQYLLMGVNIPDKASILENQPARLIEWVFGLQEAIELSELYIEYALRAVKSDQKINLCTMLPRVKYINGKAIKDFALQHGGTAEQETLISIRDIIKDTGELFAEWVIGGVEDDR